MHSSATYSAAAGLTLIFGKTFGFYDNYDRRWSNRIGKDQMETFDASRAAPTTILSLAACIWNHVWQTRMYWFNILQVSSHWSKSGSYELSNNIVKLELRFTEILLSIFTILVSTTGVIGERGNNHRKGRDKKDPSSTKGEGGEIVLVNRKGEEKSLWAKLIEINVSVREEEQRANDWANKKGCGNRGAPSLPRVPRSPSQEKAKLEARWLSRRPWPLHGAHPLWCLWRNCGWNFNFDFTLFSNTSALAALS